MELISSAILGGLIWDAIKAELTITTDYIKQKTQDYIFDQTTLAKLNTLSEQLPAAAKTSEAALIEHIKQQPDWQTLNKHIVKTSQFTQHISGEHAKGVQAGRIDNLTM
ncbi:MAG: hypothetical protein ACWA5U_04025 [bacterium]